MVGCEEPYTVLLTPDFEEELYLAAHYVEHVLHMPKAAEELLSCVETKLENQRHLSECAASYQTLQGCTNYFISCGRFNIHYTIEGRFMKILGMKHQLQN